MSILNRNDSGEFIWRPKKRRSLSNHQVNILVKIAIGLCFLAEAFIAIYIFFILNI